MSGGQVGSQTDVRLDDDPGLRPEREAAVGAAGRPRRRRRGERLMVPEAEFRSYYGKAVINEPTWQAHDIAGYLFLGGLAGASSTLAAAGELTGRPHLARACKAGALCALGGSLYALIHDLGRPGRFLHMLRVFKVISPMNMGTWILSGYGPQAGVAAATAVTGWFPRLGRAATVGAGLTGPLVATYTAALISDTAVPAWHDGYREMPFLFAGSAAASAGGLGMLAAPVGEAGPARRAALAGVVSGLLLPGPSRGAPPRSPRLRSPAGIVTKRRRYFGCQMPEKRSFRFSLSRGFRSPRGSSAGKRSPLRKGETVGF
ncbi:NrfD/PsrC family molybdoenzyme membrane anchor subunit [Streptosporangium sandarakinum]|uniref:NrfD/PsrC family molybdoenzyme membrane anchor subunit n=1 Tax=Streptosporangium sandarakinum TaxID=1260955 RepID=UPI003D8B309A